MQHVSFETIKLYRSNQLRRPKSIAEFHNCGNGGNTYTITSVGSVDRLKLLRAFELGWMNINSTLNVDIFNTTVEFQFTTQVVVVDSRSKKYSQSFVLAIRIQSGASFLF